MIAVVSGPGSRVDAAVRSVDGGRVARLSRLLCPVTNAESSAAPELKAREYLVAGALVGGRRGGQTVA